MEKLKIGTKQMVVSPHYLASLAGHSMLEKGGNAFDAAVAVSACLAVVYPHMTGLGGDSFWLMYHQKSGAVKGYNGSGRSGRLAVRERYAGEAAIPARGVRSAITVPGMADSWCEIVAAFGRLSLKDVLEPAVMYAEQGFPVSRDQCENTEKNAHWMCEIPVTSDIYLPGGKPPSPGERFVQKELAASLTILAEKGRHAFYQGEIAQVLAAYLQNNGGLLTLEDFARHKGEWVDPISTTYREYDIYQMPPNSQGFTGLMTLNILENYDFTNIKHGSFEYYHLLIEALKRSFADRNQVLTDPDFSPVPLDRLLDKAYARKLAADIGAQAMPLESPPAGSDTAYAAVMDGEGNAVSFIQSLYFEFGSGVTAGDTGIILQNRGSFFSLDPGHVNTLEPDKRSFHTLMPAMACKDGKPKILYGTQGGEGQPQTQTALLTRMIDYGMDPQTAVNEPRWVWGRTWGDQVEGLRIENRVAPEVIQKLRENGHRVTAVNDYDGIVGHAAVIQMDDHGFLRGGTDPRSDGAAIGV
ncbi:gamma-glutamyltransferase [Bacillus sp. HSf4]|uniref:gamma-glutamyltransferase n=1 Tax=Bacillus sp. HSf4 TaxID=3035514 RepID=UPI0024098700|nr:gamma-glutamyltransferase [Bacillus sp. HSf4]WFA04842.1 gamma-glutamyltransferase [Bacillus sp. HSf4]